jgi:hypothetical protein
LKSSHITWSISLTGPTFSCPCLTLSSVSVQVEQIRLEVRAAGGGRDESKHSAGSSPNKKLSSIKDEHHELVREKVGRTALPLELWRCGGGGGGGGDVWFWWWWWWT